MIFSHRLIMLRMCTTLQIQLQWEPAMAFCPLAPLAGTQWKPGMFFWVRTTHVSEAA